MKKKNKPSRMDKLIIKMFANGFKTTYAKYKGKPLFASNSSLTLKGK